MRELLAGLPRDALVPVGWVLDGLGQAENASVRWVDTEEAFRILSAVEPHLYASRQSLTNAARNTFSRQEHPLIRVRKDGGRWRYSAEDCEKLVARAVE